MAYISSTTEQTLFDANASYTPSLQSHVANDLLVIYVFQDGGGTDITTATSGWNKHGTFASSGSSRGGFFSKLAASSSETDPTFAGANDEWGAIVMVIKDADTTTPIDGISTRGDWNNVNTRSTPALTTSTNNCLLLYGHNADGTAYSHPLHQYDLLYVGGQPATTVTPSVSSTGAVGARYLGTAGSVPTITMTHEIATEGGNDWVLAIRNISGGSLGPMVASSGPEVLDYFGGSVSPSYFGTYVAPNTNITTFDSINMDTSISLNVQTSINGEITNGYDRFTTFGTTVAGPVWGGGQFTLSGTANIDNKLISFSWHLSAVGATSLGTKGVFVYYVDNSGNYEVFQITTRKPSLKSAVAYVFTHNPSTDTAYASSGTMDYTALKSMGIVYHRIAASGNLTVSFKTITAATKYGVVSVGGSAASPVSFIGVAGRAGSWGGGLQRFAIQGTGQVLATLGVQIGDGGTTATYFKATGQSVETPLYYNLSANRWTWRVDNNAIGILIKTGASDTVILSGCLLSCNTSQDFEIDSSASTSATYAFSGCVLKGPWLVTWKTGIDCSSMTFSGCGTIDGKAATFTSCSFSGSASTTYALDLADGAEVTLCAFIKGAETYAIRIAAAGTFDLSDCTFTGYTTEINVTAASGTVTINLALGQTVPDYTSAGATVVFAQPQSEAAVTSIIDGSRIQVFNVTTATEIANEIISGTSWTLSYDDGVEFTDGDTVRVRLTFQDGTDAYQQFTSNTIASATGWNILASQEALPAYTTMGIDGSTVTEFDLDVGSIEVDADDADGETTKSRLVAWFYYAVTTEDGIRDFFRAIVLEDAANAVIDPAVVDLKIDNISSQQLHFTDSDFRLYRSDGTDWVLFPSSGGYGISYGSGKVYIAETGVSGLTSGESDKLMSLDTTNLDATVSSRISKSQFLALK